jgi:hemoglobin
MSDTTGQTVFEAAGGHAGLLALARAWHACCVAHPVVSHAFEGRLHPQHVERLASYWAEALGGPADYSRTMANETIVQRMHAGNGAHPEFDAMAVQCFEQALVDAGFAANPRLCQSLADYFRWSTTRMTAYPDSADHVPGGLALPHWTWDGPVGAG